MMKLEKAFGLIILGLGNFSETLLLDLYYKRFWGGVVRRGGVELRASLKICTNCGFVEIY